MDTNDGVRLRELEGRRSTQEMGRSVFAAAALPADPDLAAEIEREKEWRKKYLGPLRRLIEAGARSRDAALGIARAGLARVHERVEFAGDGQAPSLVEAVATSERPRLGTETLKGEGDIRRDLAIPYRGELLAGDSLRRQLDTWVDGGIIEVSSREAVEKVIANPDWLDLSDRRFVILGGASEMGALEALSGWGAHIAAIDLPVPGVWERIIEKARAGRGRLDIPVRQGAGPLTERAGADLLKDLPDIAAWLGHVEAPFTAVDDTYADGATFVLVASAADALVGELAKRDGVSLAYLATPTDVFAVPEQIVLETRSKRESGRRISRALTGGALYQPNYADLVTGEDGRRWGIIDSLVAQQGANYALAKTLQRWRAVTARDDGTLVSSNVAPATRTKSVTKNKALAAAYRGASAYGIEIFEPDTSRWLMAALLVHDLRNAGDGPTGGHPYDLFADGATHGGLWRLPYEPRSILPLAVLRGMLRRT